MKFKSMASILVLALLSAALSLAQEKTEQQKNAEKKRKIRTMSAQTLQELYKLQPTSQAAIQKAAGYAVFK